MNNLKKIRQILTLTSVAHSIIYMISSLKWEMNPSPKYSQEIDRICDEISKFYDKTDEELYRIEEMELPI